MRRIVSVLLVVCTMFCMMFSVTGCKDKTHYNTPQELLADYEAGKVFSEEACTLTFTTNYSLKTVRNFVYEVNSSAGYNSNGIEISLPLNEDVEPGTIITIVVTDVKFVAGTHYSILGYLRK